jgi:hypothetical protein
MATQCGLTRDDFTVREDGRPQSIAGFEAREPPALRVATAAPEPATAATNVDTAPDAGRVFAVLIDDLGLTPPTASQVRAAMAGWLREPAAPDDEVTLLTTSRDVWWSDRVVRRRDDLVAVLDALERLSTELASAPGRKSILLVSEGFLRETSSTSASGA